MSRKTNRDHAKRQQSPMMEDEAISVEESYQGAAQRFQEHYQFEFESNSLRRFVSQSGHVGESKIFVTAIFPTFLGSTS